MLRTGYAYEYRGTDWRGSDQEEWELVIVSETGDPNACTEVGRRRLDGNLLHVYERKANGESIYFAQL